MRLQSYRKKLTIFFSDIKDFTRLTDTLEPETLTSIINTYLDEMAAIALRHGGTIDKYIGDAIMIFFGDPETRGEKEDALACVKMAIEMREHMKKVHNENLIPSGTPPLQIRMGINSGYCTVGNFGSEERLDYTIIGGPVNLASRLESQAEPNEILISRSTYALIKDEIASEERGEITVKGIARPVQIYQVVDLWKNFKKGPEQVHLQGHGFSFQMNLDALSGESKVKAYSCLEHLKTRLDEKPKN